MLISKCFGGLKMSGYLPKAVIEALQDARVPSRPSAPLTLKAGDVEVPVIELTERGFAVATGPGIVLRGHVDIYRGSEHIRRGLIVASAVEPGRTLFEFKQQSSCNATQPLDFVDQRDNDGLLSSH